MIQNYTFMLMSDIPDKNGTIYPKDIAIELPKQVNVYFNDFKDEAIVGYGFDIKKSRNRISANIRLDVKKFKKSFWATHAACPLIRSIKLRPTDYGEEVVSCKLIGLVLSERPSIREIKKLIEK